MGEMITKPDANPIVLAICNWFIFGFLGYFMMGQKSKATKSVIIAVVLTCFGLSPIWIIITAVDAYMLGQKLQSGESIGMNENGLDFLNAIFKD